MGDVGWITGHPGYLRLISVPRGEYGHTIAISPSIYTLPKPTPSKYSRRIPDQRDYQYLPPEDFPVPNTLHPLTPPFPELKKAVLVPTPTPRGMKIITLVPGEG